MFKKPIITNSLEKLKNFHFQLVKFRGKRLIFLKASMKGLFKEILQERLLFLNVCLTRDDVNLLREREGRVFWEFVEQFLRGTSLFFKEGNRR